MTATASATRCGLLPVFKSGLVAVAGKPALATHPMTGTLGGAGGAGGSGKLPGKTGAGRGLTVAQDEPEAGSSEASCASSSCASWASSSCASCPSSPVHPVPVPSAPEALKTV